MKQMDFNEAKDMLQKYNIKVADSEIAETKNQAVKIAQKLGFPVVMKIISPDIVHKSDAGGIIVNVNSIPAVQHAFNEIEKNAKKYKRNAEITGVLVQKQAMGKEIIIGGKRDPQFGPIVLFGMGGIFVQVLKDVSMRIAPVDLGEAMRMIKEVKGYSILSGIRGEKPVAINKIARSIIRVSNLMMDEDTVKEMDLNPSFVNEKECVAADIRVLV